MLEALAARAILLAARALPTILTGLKTGLLSGGVNKTIIYTNMINAIEYRNVKSMISIYLHIHVLLKVMDCS